MFDYCSDPLDADDVGYCDACGREYLGTEADHLTNLSHLVRLTNFFEFPEIMNFEVRVNRTNPTHSGFFIPEWNAGFKLLRKAGWGGESGLGRRAQVSLFRIRANENLNFQGTKYPVKTILKRNRAGLGARKEVISGDAHIQSNKKSATAPK